MLTSLYCSITLQIQCTPYGVVFYALLSMIATIRDTYLLDNLVLPHTHTTSQTKDTHLLKKGRLQSVNIKTISSMFCLLDCLFSSLHAYLLHPYTYALWHIYKNEKYSQTAACSWWYSMTGGYLQQEQARSWFQTNNKSVSKLNSTSCDSTKTMLCREYSKCLCYSFLNKHHCLTSIIIIK